MAVARSMLDDLMAEAASVGLEVHESKTKIIQNGTGRGTNRKELIIQGRPFEVLGTRRFNKVSGTII